MLNFEKHTYIKKSKSDIETENITNNLSRKLWKDSGYNTAYLLGVVNYLKGMINMKHEFFTKSDLLTMLIALKDDDNTPDEIKSLIDTIIKENNNDK